MALLIDILDRVVAWIEARRTRESASVSRLIDLMHEACIALIEAEDPNSESIRYVQGKLRTLYKRATQELGGRLSEEDLDAVMRALERARIYYWLRVLDGMPKSEAEQLLSEVDESPESTSSLKGYLRIIRPLAPRDQLKFRLPRVGIEFARDLCLESIAELEVIRSRYTSKS